LRALGYGTWVKCDYVSFNGSHFSLPSVAQEFSTRTMEASSHMSNAEISASEKPFEFTMMLPPPTDKNNEQMDQR